MRHREVRARPATTNSHPFMADLIMVPTAFRDFERAMEDRQDVRLLARIDRPGRWVVHIACTTEAVRHHLLDAWGWPARSRSSRRLTASPGCRVGDGRLLGTNMGDGAVVGGRARPPSRHLRGVWPPPLIVVPESRLSPEVSPCGYRFSHHPLLRDA
jgi:hypothetical protein